MDVLLACSLNTVLVNGNPLLRYDGYRILAKPAEIPSLRCSSSLSG
jgi:putative peptide zinc metalloprotease protein